jgi:hypothetical protein
MSVKPIHRTNTPSKESHAAIKLAYNLDFLQLTRNCDDQDWQTRENILKSVHLPWPKERMMNPTRVYVDLEIPRNLTASGQKSGTKTSSH